MFKQFFLISWLLFFLTGALLGENLKTDQKKWQRFSGQWKIKNGYLEEQRGWVSPWNYYLLLNYNTLLSLKKYPCDSSIHYNLVFFEPQKKETEILLSLAVSSPYKNWNYHLYAFRFKGDDKKINSLEFIYSDRKDKLKSYSTKNNFFIKILAKNKVSLEYQKKYFLKIEIDKKQNQAQLKIDHKTILKAPFPLKSNGDQGKIGFSTKNVKLKVDNIFISQSKKKKSYSLIIFRDDFDYNSIKVLKGKGKITTNKKKTSLPKIKKSNQTQKE